MKKQTRISLELHGTFASRSIPRSSIVHLSIWFCLLSFVAAGQAPGSTYSNNLPGNTVPTGTVTEIIAESAYFGPGSVWDITGDLFIYSKNVWIAPTAQFTGSGKITFKNPSLKGGASSPTFIDANNTDFIPVNIVHDNLSDMVLTNLDAAVAANPNLNFTMPEASTLTTADLKIGKNFNMIAINNYPTDPFNGGDLVLDGSNFVFDADATITGYRKERYVITNSSIAGHMIKLFDATHTTFTFPVGFPIRSYSYSPTRITASSGTFYVSVQDPLQSISDESVLQEQEFVHRTWHIYADAPTSAKVELQFEDLMEDGGWMSNDPYIVTRWLGGTVWERNPEAIGDPGDLADPTPTNGPVGPFTAYVRRDLTTTVVGSPTESLSYWTVSFLSNTALPVNLISFNAIAEGATSLLSWKTASETNSFKFAVQRSADAKVWNTIGEVAASGESSTEQHYSFTDAQPLSKGNYYRLKMIDIDEKFAYSTIRSVTLTESETQTYTYPNPTRGNIKLSDKDLSQISSIEIVDGSAISIFQTKSISKRGIDVQNLKNGNYILKICYKGGAIVSHRIIIAR